MIWKALATLYRIVLLPKPNIDVLSIDSTREGSRKSIPAPNSPQNFQIFIKMNRMTSTAINNNITTNIMNIISNHSSGRGPALTKHTSLNAAPSMTIVTCEISKSDHLHRGNLTVLTARAPAVALAQYRCCTEAPSMIGWHVEECDPC